MASVEEAGSLVMPESGARFHGRARTALGSGFIRMALEPKTNLRLLSMSYLEDHIRNLCGQAIRADEEQAAAILNELQAALREHTRRVREAAAARESALTDKTRPPQ